MTTQEQQMIQSLADRINNTPLAEKDLDAEQFLQQAISRNPDALYILAQTTLVQGYALEQAQKQLADVRAQLDQQRQQAQQPRHATSFLGNLLGRHDDLASPPPQQSYPAQYTPVPDYNQPSRPYPSGGSSFSGSGSVAPPPYGYGQPQYGQPQYIQPQSGSFLRSAMQTATGVAAGALAFEGIESLMHGFGSSGGSFGSSRPEEIINNNYYGDASPAEHRGVSSDIEDRRNDAGGFSDAVDHDDHNFGRGEALDATDADDASSGDDFTADDNSMDDSSFDDDSSNIDDSSPDNEN
jgi:hypothetical protein